ncbi:MAG: GNAT family N-acetyltransferase, partial [bacterium]|nr:GNAT family N-acetyltransferase [bacterium]
MEIRKATENDFARIMEIYDIARKYMAEHGNPKQWGINKWPPAEVIQRDINSGSLYVCVSAPDKVIGVFFFAFGKDIEPTYRVIHSGAWIVFCKPFLHKIAKYFCTK